MEDQKSRGLARRIAGEIVMSPNPSDTIRKWRGIFDISQVELARQMGVSPSVISDYESGRRRSPRIDTIHRIIDSVFEIDISRGGETLNSLERMMIPEVPEGVVLAMKEFSFPVEARVLAEGIDGDVIIGEELMGRNIFGYTVIDSVKAILEMRSGDFIKFYGLTSERALIFTQVATGRSPFVAIKVGGMNPGLVVLHGERLSLVDELGKKIAEKENIPIVVSRCSTVGALIERLREVA
jgi:putative transcriptional regulator